MYPTEEPMERARLCLSCHLGTERKFATHEIMGAGHPRLAFELELYGSRGSVSIDKARRELGYDPKIDFPAGLIQTAHYIRNK